MMMSGADTFMCNVKKGRSMLEMEEGGYVDGVVDDSSEEDSTASTSSPTSSPHGTFDDGEMDKDGYYNMLSCKQQSILDVLLR